MKTDTQKLRQLPKPPTRSAVAQPTGSARPEIIGPGICDLCGKNAPELVAIYAAPIAGACGCKECMGDSWPNNRIQSAVVGGE